MLQSGLLRVVTWLGSRFLQKRFLGSKYLVPAHSPWCSSVLSSAIWIRTLISRKELWWLRNQYEVSWTRQSRTFCLWYLTTQLVLCWEFFFENAFQDFLFFFFSWLLPKRLINKFRLSGLFVFFYSSYLFFEQVVDPYTIIDLLKVMVTVWVLR